MQVSLSICLIIKNEEKYLSRCLSSVKDIATEIIIADTGSSDNSKIIASEFSPYVYSYKWTNDFSSARNFCLDKATGDWIMVLDGDEELDEGCLELLQENMQRDREAYLVTVNNYYDKVPELLAIPDLQLRLFRNNKQYRYKGIIHEQILDSILDHNPAARVEIVRDISITHYGYDADNEKRLKRNTELLKETWCQEDDEQFTHFYLGREYYHHRKYAEALDHFLFVFNIGDAQQKYLPELLRSIAICMYMVNRLPEALGFINNALEILADMGDLYYLKGYFCKAQGYYADAYEAFQKSLSVGAQPLNYASSYCQHEYKTHYYLGGLAEYFMDKDDALHNYFEALKQNPYALDSLRRMIAILNPRINSEYTINSLNKVFDLSDTGLSIEMALIFYGEGAYQLALDCIQRLENSGPIAENIRLLKGLSLLRNRQFQEAEEELQLIINNKTLYITARQYLLLYYWLVQDYRKVSGCLRRINNAGADADMVYVLNLLIRGNSTKNKNTVSSQVYALVKEIMDLLIELGDNCRVSEAFQNLGPLLGERPSHLLAEYFYKYEKYELAEKEFRCLLEANDKDAWTFYYLGKIFWVQGDLNSAEKHLREAIEKGLDTPKIRMETARLYQEQAIAALSECFKLCPVSKEREDYIQVLESVLLEV